MRSSSCRLTCVLVARGLPCPVGLVRGGRRNTLVLKVTFRLDGANVWAGTQAPLREMILDDSGRRVFPSDFQAHKSALDVVIAGATLNALGPVRLRVGRHQMFAEDPRLLGPVPLSDSGRDSSFAWPNQQLPLQEFPLQLEVVFAAARTLLSVTAAPVYAALLRDDWSSVKSVPLNLDALLVDPMREVAEFVFRGFFADTPDTMVAIGPTVFDSRVLQKARRWPRAEALEPRARSVRETAYDLDEETFVADAVSDVTTKLRRPDFDEESTAIRSLQTTPSQPPLDGSAPVAPLAVEATQRFVAPTLPTSALAEFHRQDVVVPAPATSPDRPFAPTAKVSLVEETVVNFAIPKLSTAELPFASESTQLLRVALQPGPELPFAKPKQQPSSEAPPVELPFQRSASRTMLGGEAAGRALPFQSGAAVSPRKPSMPPDAGLPFRHPSAPPVPMPADVAPVLPLIATPAIAPPPISPVAAIPPEMAMPLAAIPPVVVSPATGLSSLDGLTIEQYAKIRSRLWQGEPRAEVLREHKLTELRFRLFEKRLQRDLDALPPGELVKVLELLG